MVANARLTYGETGVSSIACLGGDFDGDGSFTINDAAFVAMAQFYKAKLPWQDGRRKLAGSPARSRGEMIVRAVRGASARQLEVHLHGRKAAGAQWRALSVQFIGGNVTSVRMHHDVHGQITVQHAGSFFQAAELGGRGLSWPLGHVATVTFGATTNTSAVRVNYTSFNTYVL